MLALDVGHHEAGLRAADGGNMPFEAGANDDHIVGLIRQGNLSLRAVCPKSSINQLSNRSRGIVVYH